MVNGKLRSRFMRAGGDRSGELGRLERRAAARRRGPGLAVELEGHTYISDNWSLGGFRLPALHRPTAPGERFAGIARDLAGSVSGEILAEAVWSDGERIGFRFLALAPRLRLGLAAFRQG